MNLEQLQQVNNSIRAGIERVVVGQEEAVTLLLVSLLAEGHILFEGVPGTAKTLLARTFAQLVSLTFKRIQFTPDLLPGDLLGTNLFDFSTSEFKLTRGPIFTELLLADEINRTPPKTQAALLEAMQERRVTIDGDTHDLGEGFMVVATQNPLEQEGTYPLPEAQLDRFLFKVIVGYPTRDQERALVRRHGHSGVRSSPGGRSRDRLCCQKARATDRTERSDDRLHRRYYSRHALAPLVDVRRLAARLQHARDRRARLRRLARPRLRDPG